MKPGVERMLRLLAADAGTAAQDGEFDARSVDLSDVTPEDLGMLKVASRRVNFQDAPPQVQDVKRVVDHALGDREVRYSAASCRTLFDVLVEQCSWRYGSPDLRQGLHALDRCSEPVPDVSEQAATLVGLVLEKVPVRQPRALIAVAGLAGEEALQRAVAGLLVYGGPLFADEMAVLAGLGPAEQRILTALDREFPLMRHEAEMWHDTARIPAYVAFTRRVLEAAADRAEAIHDGVIPYRADKAFTAPEVVTLGLALRVALIRDEPWLPELCARLLPAITLAPGTAKTLPSQGLLYEITRAAQEFPTPELVAALRTVRRTVRHAGVPKQLDKLLKKADAALAERTEVALRLPRLGFDDSGVLRRKAAPYEGVLTVTDSATLTWEKDGRTLRSAPAPLRRDHPDLVKELRDLAKRVDAQLATLLKALEGSFVVDATYPYGWWRTDLAAHPLARTHVNRLIWELETAPGTWHAFLPAAEAGTEAEGAAALPDAPAEARIRLWHPLRSRPDDVRAWRDVLSEQQLRQPFKQAYREVYLLTPAENETRTYSNRFAAHLVHYQQLFALFRARGWQSTRLGPWDAGDSAMAERTLASGQWRVRFAHTWAESTDEHDLAGTDAVRFDRRESGTWQEAPLADVPPLVLSEAMRDVDLFVGVTSIAADPDWTDGGTRRAYWERAGFAALDQSAEARREALARIVPRLKIADRCTLDGRFLVVRGELTTYKIHIGSANILMAPHDAYLCIVPDRRTTTKQTSNVFLPFEDSRLALILSKALLLAADTEITDASILGQIKAVCGAPVRVQE
ncbi:DUF4132 domain-containing protein [Streptomyces sp. NPDC050418]|uniref:DUF4132 domain-containing protein n=1 Tax=Streptomyces sp. NPDC050418 TaxID=3365612 RepID=UPI0037BD733E